MFGIIALGAFAGVVVFGALFLITVLRRKPKILAAVGMFVCFAALIGSSALLILSDGDGGGLLGGLLRVTLTIPAEYVDGGMTQERLDKAVEENGLRSAELNEDGSVTCVMSRAKHKELMEGIRQEIEESLAGLANSEETPNITGIEHNEDYSEYTVKLQADDVGPAESLAVLGLYFNSGMYHVFNGTEIDNVNIRFVNEATGEVVREANSKDMEGPDGGPAEDGGPEGGDGGEPPAAPADPASQPLLLDHGGVKVTFMGFREKDKGCEIRLSIENTSETDYTVQVRDVSANDVMCDAVFSCDVMAGKKANDGIWLMNLEDNGVELPVAAAEFKFVIFEAGDFFGDSFTSDVVVVPGG